MPELTQPPLGRKPNLPPVVPLSQAPPDKQEEYRDLLDLENSEPEDNPAQVRSQESAKSTVSDEDKLAFVESILGGRPYSKIYKLFGGSVLAEFQDRSVGDSEQIYKQLDEDYEKGEIKSDEQWQVALERYQMACGLVSLNMSKSKSAVNVSGSFQERLSTLIKLPQPIYRALMETSRKFENDVNLMVEKAGDSDFWAAGG